MDPSRGRTEKPKLTANTRRHIRVQIYLPFLLGLAVITGFAAWLWSVIAEASPVADVSFICLALPAILLGLLVLGLVLGCVYLVWKLTQGVSAPFRKLNRQLGRLERWAKSGSDVAVKPLMQSKAVWAGVGAFFRGIRSIFRGEEGSGYE